MARGAARAPRGELEHRGVALEPGGGRWVGLTAAGRRDDGGGRVERQTRGREKEVGRHQGARRAIVSGAWAGSARPRHPLVRGAQSGLRVPAHAGIRYCSNSAPFGAASRLRTAQPLGPVAGFPSTPPGLPWAHSGGRSVLPAPYPPSTPPRGARPASPPTTLDHFRLRSPPP